MGQIAISEEILADIMSALREANHTSQTYDLAHAAMGVFTIDTAEDWDWAQNDGRTYLHMNIWNPDFVTIKLFIQINGTIDWGDGSAIETYTDTAFIDHEHTYQSIGKYVIILDGDSINLGNSETAHLLRNNDNLVQRYIDKIEFGHNVSRSVAQWGLPAVSWVYYATGSPNATVTSDGFHKNVRHIYLNGQNFTINGYGFSGGGSMVTWEGFGTLTTAGLHCFGNPATSIVTLSESIPIQMNRTSGNSNYFCYSSRLTPIMHLSNLIGDPSRGMASYVTGTYYWINMPSNCATWNDSTSRITIPTDGELHCYNTTPPTIASNTITCQTGAKIYVPTDCLEAYQTATNWSALADYMEEE